MADSTEFKPVTLVSPDGREHVATTAEEHVNLVYGHGYSEKSSKSTKNAEGE